VRSVVKLALPGAGPGCLRPGGSYTSAPLVPNQYGEPIDCGRSDHNYPSLVAQEFKVDTFVDVSCGSAQTKHMTEPQTDLPLGGTNPPQFNALRADATLVTVGIGGNDAGLVGSQRSPPSWAQPTRWARPAATTGRPAATTRWPRRSRRPSRRSRRFSKASTSAHRTRAWRSWAIPTCSRGVGRIRLGYTRAALARRVPVAPARRTRDSQRFCTKRGSGSVTAVFSNRSRAGRVELILSTAPTAAFPARLSHPAAPGARPVPRVATQQATAGSEPPPGPLRGGCGRQGTAEPA
jgi:GDSL-like Lipase/Acylhydrolase family